jgi:5'-3' exonuclease
MGLTREDLAVMALFMGCDYTGGVRGIAAVNAIEVINCFGNQLADLQSFREWVDIST